MNQNKVISLVFIRVRISKGLNQSVFAKYLQCSQSEISKIEAGIHFPSASLIEKLSQLEQSDLYGLIEKYITKYETKIPGQ